MTEHKHQKALIRARMARTGESYVVARSHIVEAAPEPGLAPLADFKAHDRHCMTAVYTPDSDAIVSGGFGGQARIWTLDGAAAGELIGHDASVNVVRISSDGSVVLTASSDKTVRSWDLAARQPIAQLGRHKRQVIALDLDERGRRAWSGAPDGSVLGWDVDSGQPAGRMDIGDHVTSLSVRPGDGAVAVGTMATGVSVRDSEGTEVVRLPIEAVVTSVVWARDGSFLVVGSADDASVWASDGWELVRTMSFGGAGVHPVAVSPDGSRVVLGWDHHIALWAADGDSAAVVVDGLPKGVYGLSFSPDGRALALGCADGRVRTWAVR